MTKETDITKELDTLYPRACWIVQSTGDTRISHLQRALLIGYNRAARLIEAMEADGIVSPCDSCGLRKLLALSHEQKTLAGPLEIGTRIRFNRDLTEPASGDHPALLYAYKGEAGTIIGYSAKEGYLVRADHHHAKFGAALHEFDVTSAMATAVANVE